jgi:hypothetical protein
MKGLPAMKKLLSLAIVAAALGASVGCDDKKSTGGAKPATSPNTNTNTKTTP